jgi:hypothetical protein
VIWSSCPVGIRNRFKLTPHLKLGLWFLLDSFFVQSNWFLVVVKLETEMSRSRMTSGELFSSFCGGRKILVRCQCQHHRIRLWKFWDICYPLRHWVLRQGSSWAVPSNLRRPLPRTEVKVTHLSLLSHQEHPNAFHLHGRWPSPGMYPRTNQRSHGISMSTAVGWGYWACREQQQKDGLFAMASGTCARSTLDAVFFLHGR